ncbi:hypothetical protein VII00023_14800 [Vibrio ichthyoenteri ATCC 700023]|uniref:Uncharacterized protein n=1 Tax=Vibrio ichthyoenteri ATCC 700023 TaxID=870968 RepID=F9RWJ6_9VIBR|nr:hypothetical protein VII00023_14800 [Vibrio ichthyoenteri ATCC 700023]
MAPFFWLLYSRKKQGESRKEKLRIKKRPSMMSVLVESMIQAA